MTTLRVILGDQLSNDISSLSDCNKENDIILLAEVWNEATYVKHHVKKICFIFSAMRHFAQELKKKNYKVIYHKLDIKDNKSSFTSVVKDIIKSKKISRIIITEPGEYRVLQEIKSWIKFNSIELEIRSDTRFLCSIEEFKKWIKDYKQPRMEFFYRSMRLKYNILVHNNKPIGGKWNFDPQNRKPADEKLTPKKTYKARKDKITQDVINLVSKKFPDHFGDIEPFYFAVTRKQALFALNHFIEHNLQYFGAYQDIMLEGEPWLYHSHISHYINIGLLLPLECIEAALVAYQNKKAPINSVEGFIRQILGWREYIRGIYWLKIPSYQKQNFLTAQKNLPDFFWTANTDLNCLKQCITETKQHSYAHHIQRLMVLGNFCLLAGIHPKYVNEWYLIVYADAFEWVEMPNVTGMILFADGGFVASKPYAAGGSYINKMSNYCKNCHYDINQKTGDKACPFNYLYWNFLIKNQNKLKNNQRLRMIYSTLSKMSPSKINDILSNSKKFLDSL